MALETVSNDYFFVTFQFAVEERKVEGFETPTFKVSFIWESGDIYIDRVPYFRQLLKAYFS